MENWYEVFRGWVEELAPLGQVEAYTVTEQEGVEGEDAVVGAWVSFYTSTTVYRIKARAERLVCDAEARAWVAGEDWHRGHDCGDGNFSRVTWDRILLRILQSEFVKVSKRRPGVGVADETPASAGEAAPAPELTRDRPKFEKV